MNKFLSYIIFGILYKNLRKIENILGTNFLKIYLSQSNWRA